MCRYPYHIGVDVSKNMLDFVIVEGRSAQLLKHMHVPNAEGGIYEVFDYLSHCGILLEDTLFCCENTGIYTYPLATVLAREKIDHWIIHAIEIKLSNGLVRGKNDKTDAKGIALYSLRNIDKLKLFRIPLRDIQKLRLLFSEREKASRALQIFRTTKENQRFTSRDIFSPVEILNIKIVREIRSHRNKIECAMREIIERDPSLKSNFSLVTSIPGIGEFTAIYFIITTGNFVLFDTWRKYACYAGVAPFEHQSGASLKRTAHVHHAGNKKMKSMLRMCALVSLRYDFQMKSYYKKKKEEGKHHRLILNNIKCKLISRVFAVIKRQAPFANINGYAN